MSEPSPRQSHCVLAARMPPPRPEQSGDGSPALPPHRCAGVPRHVRPLSTAGPRDALWGERERKPWPGGAQAARGRGSRADLPPLFLRGSRCWLPTGSGSAPHSPSLSLVLSAALITCCTDGSQMQSPLQESGARPGLGSPAPGDTHASRRSAFGPCPRRPLTLRLASHVCGRVLGVPVSPDSPATPAPS